MTSLNSNIYLTEIIYLVPFSFSVLVHRRKTEEQTLHLHKISMLSPPLRASFRTRTEIKDIIQGFGISCDNFDNSQLRVSRAKVTAHRSNYCSRGLFYWNSVSGGFIQSIYKKYQNSVDFKEYFKTIYRVFHW